MRRPSLASSALAARLLSMITIFSQDSFAANTTSIQDGDTFFAIASSAGIPVESLEAANPGVDADNLYVGQAINIPSNNEPATATPISESESSLATATGLSTTPSPVSTSPTASSATQSLSSTFSTSTLPPSSTSPPPSSTSPPSSTHTPSSTSSPASSTRPPSSTSSPPSSTSTSSPSSSTSPPPSSTSPPSTTSSSVPPVSPVAAPVCKPSPSGKYHDADNVQRETNAFCTKMDSMSQSDIEENAGWFVSGSSQGSSGHDGNQPNEKGYNMTITVISPDCVVEGATAQYPLGITDTNDNCSTILFNTWRKCNNEGMGGSIAAGCMIFAFNPDP